MTVKRKPPAEPHPVCDVTILDADTEGPQ